MSDKLPAFTVEQRDQVIKLSKVGAFEINFENEEIVVYAMCEPNDAEKKLTRPARTVLSFRRD